MATPLTDIRGIGPAQERALTAAGIADAETLRALGADAAYARMVAAGSRPHFIAYYALHMALQGRNWNDCRGAEKAALRVDFDRLIARLKQDPDVPSPDLAAFLDRIGLRRRGV